MTTAIQNNDVFKEINRNQESTQESTRGCWSRWKRRATWIKDGGVGLFSGMIDLAKDPSSALKKAHRLTGVLQENWDGLKRILEPHTKTLIYNGIEIALLSTCYTQTNYSLEVPVYILIYSLGMSILADQASHPPQEDPELLTWKAHLETLQRQRPIKKPIYLDFSKDVNASCTGSVDGINKQIIIKVQRDLYQFTKEEKLFLLAHEYSHALHSDEFYKPIITCLVQLLGASTFWLSSSPDSFLFFRAIKFSLTMKGLGTISNFLQLKYREKRADDTALQFQPQEEIAQAAVSFFERIRLVLQTHRSQPEKSLIESYAKKLQITPSGNLLLDDHPLLTYRRDRALTVLQSAS